MRSVLVGLAASAVLAASAQAAIIANWNFDDGNTIVDAKDANVTISNLGDLSASDGNAGFGWGDTVLYATSFSPPASGKAFWKGSANAGRKLGFELTNNSTSSLTLDTFDFVSANNFGGADTIGLQYLLGTGTLAPATSSLSSFTGNSGTTGGSSNTTTAYAFSLNLSPMGSDGILAPGASLRLFIVNVSGNNAMVLDNIVLNGTVPEPASMAVLALGSLALLRRRRA